MCHHLFRRALRHDAATVDAGTGANVDHIVRQPDGVLVMLHHDDGVADVAQMHEGFQQPVIVALVQADGGFVQHIKHAGEARTNLRGEADALAFTARQRAGHARERQIVQADIDEEAQALADFLENAGGDFLLL